MKNASEDILKEVVLIVEENNKEESSAPVCEIELYLFAQQLELHNIGFCYKRFLPEDTDKILQELSDKALQTLKGRLYISDSEAVIRCLLKQGACVVLLLHEHNREGNFDGIQYATEGLEGADYDYLYHVYQRLTGQPWTILTTNRFVVREITIEDVPALYEIYAEPEVVRYTENLYENVEEELQYTKDYIEKVYGFYGYGIWIVEDKRTGRIIGRAGLEYKEGREGAELGVVIAKPFWCQGVATEVVEAILTYAKEKLDIFHVFAMVEAENEKSIRFFTKMQFKYTENEIIHNKTYKIYEIDI